MLSRKTTLAAAASALALLTACSSQPQRSQPTAFPSTPSMGQSNTLQYGNVSNIELVPMSTRSSTGGAVLGAVIGAVVGNQIGCGSGRAVATGVGAVGGAVIGSNIARNRADNEVYRISVRMDNGGTAQFDYERVDDLRIGDRVRVEGGQILRV